jgi:hypothetical protein
MDMKNIKEVLTSSRFKSFYWRTGMMIVAAVVAFLVENVSAFNLPPEVTVVVGLILGEVSKYLNAQAKA